jgi:hypothetical protein
MTTVTASTGIRHGMVTAPAVPVRPSRTTFRLTRRGRRLLALLAASPVVTTLAIAMIAGGSAIASRDDGAPSASFEMVTVTGGDTLWSLAQDVAPTADPRDVVDAIARLNALDGVTITPGQRLAIPAEYSAAD